MEHSSPVHLHRATPIEDPATRKRLAEEVRGYAAAAAFMGKIRRYKKAPKSVKFMTIDEHADKWGQTENSIYRITEEGQIEGFPGDYMAGMSLEILTRGRDE